LKGHPRPTSQWTNEIIDALRINFVFADSTDEFFDSDVEFDEEELSELKDIYNLKYNKTDIKDKNFSKTETLTTPALRFFHSLRGSLEQHERKIDLLATNLAFMIFTEPNLKVTSEALHVTIGDTQMGCVDDLLVVETKKNIFVVIFEDKTKNNSGLYQIAGEMIAAVQANDNQNNHENEKEKMYGVRVMGPTVSFFFVEYSRQVLNAFRDGETPPEPTRVLLCPPKKPGGPNGLSLLVPDERDEIIEILAKMKVQIKKDIEGDNEDK